MTTQYAVQLTGPNKLILNKEKEVWEPSENELKAKVNAVGLCFSDMKLLDKFDHHARKGKVLGELGEIISKYRGYVPDKQPTVPGHETCLAIDNRLWASQGDYRRAKTSAGSNGAIGYNFEGGLQEYMLMDKRLLTDDDKEYYLIPFSDKFSFSAIALAEPWACVEASYSSEERKHIRQGGSFLLVSETNDKDYSIDDLFAQSDPGQFFTFSVGEKSVLNVPSGQKPVPLESLSEQEFDDIVYMGNNAATIEMLAENLSASGLLNIVTMGKQVNKSALIDVGNMHYKGTRIIGTMSNKAVGSYNMVPESTELKKGSSLLVIGAAGPMGQMHILRAAMMEQAPSRVIAIDISAERLAVLEEKVRHVTAKSRHGGISDYRSFVPEKGTVYEDTFDYITVLVPSAKLVADSINNCNRDCLINIFAGIKDQTGEININKLIRDRIYLFGTSGSPLRAMQTVAKKIQSHQLDPDISVDVIGGMKGALEGLEGVKNRMFPGKVVIYPQLRDLELVLLENLKQVMPDVFKKLDAGRFWTKEAEKQLFSHVDEYR